MEGKEQLLIVFCCLGEADSRLRGCGTHKSQGDQGPKEAGNDNTEHKPLPALGQDVRKLIQHSCDHSLQACKLRGTHKGLQRRLCDKSVTF